MKSIITNYTEFCAFCGKPTSEIHHCVFGRGLRELSDKDGLVIGICDKCHSEIHVTSSVAGRMSKMIGQLAWEKDLIEKGGVSGAEARELFRKRFGRSYI